MGCDSKDSSLYEYEELSKDGGNFRQTLLERIDEIQATGSFATGNVLEFCPIPGICVDGGEPIALPLSKEAAQNLASKSDRAPFGRRRRTLVDETVRKTLQISADRIKFQNPRWDGFVNKLVQRVAHELGVPPARSGSNVRAELYKHLLYEPGAMFKPHKDTEKDPGMFGTLIICLPSEHTGGAVCLQHGNNSLELSTAETSAYDFYYLAWYADVTHEIKPVQTGYRWVLTYNLIIDYEDSRLSASVLDSQIQSLVEVLSLWPTLHHTPDFLVYPLDHQYTLRNLRLSSLKGLDYQRARCLADSCERHGEFYLFLAQLNKTESWIEEEDEILEMTHQTVLNNVRSLEGFELSPLEVKIDGTSLLASINYERNPDFRGGGEYTGNAHGEIFETYSDMVLTIVRADSLHIPLCGPSSPQDVDSVMRHLRAGINHNTETTLQKILVRLCRIILDQGLANGAANDTYLGYAAVTAAFLSDWPLFEEAREKTLKAWDHSSWSALGGLIDLQAPPIEMDDIFKDLFKCGTFRGVCEGLTHLYDGFCGSHFGQKDPAKAEYGKQWYSDKLIKTLNLRNISMEEEDAATIKAIVLDLKIRYTPEQRKKIDEAITNSVNEFKKVKNFVNALNIELLLELSNPKNARKEFVSDLLRVISEFAISMFDLRLYYAYVKRSNSSKTDVLMRDFYNQTLHDKKLTSNLLRQLSTQAPHAEKDTVLSFPSLLMKELLTSVDTRSLEVQTCFQLLVGTYITKTVGEEPSKPEDWARPAEVQKCLWVPKAFSELNHFLKDPEAKEITIALKANDRKHVEWCFEYLVIENGDREGEARCAKTLKWWEKRHRKWVLDGEAAQRELRELPKYALKQALGDKYDTLMALDLVRIGKSTAQDPEQAQPPSRPRGKKGRDAENTAPVRASKRARRN